MKTVKGVLALVVANSISCTSNPTLKDSSQFSQGSLRPLTMATSLWSDIIGTDLEHHTKSVSRCNLRIYIIKPISSFIGEQLWPAYLFCLPQFTDNSIHPTSQMTLQADILLQNGLTWWWSNPVQGSRWEPGPKTTQGTVFCAIQQQLCYPSRPQAWGAHF